MKFPDVLNVNGREYTLVKTRREAPMAVYKYQKSILRAGKKEDVIAEIKQRDLLKENGFPVPRRFKEAETQEGLYYYTEESLGNENFSDLFKKDMEREGKINEKTWKQFLKIVREFAEAQLKTKTKEGDIKVFEKAIDLKDIYSEFPSDRSKIEKMWEETKERLSIFPFVLTHGDFNSHNLYRDGVIDFEGLFYAPAGYDLVTNIYTPELFPLFGEYEITDPLHFDEAQRKEYYEIFDNLYLENGVPRLSDYKKYFQFCRATWMTANKSHIPNLQKFRYDLYKKNYLDS